MNKKIVSLFLLYLFQFIATSCVSCKCASVGTYERIYIGLELKAWDTSGFQNVEVSDFVYKNSFGLSLAIESELNQIAHYKPKLNLSSFGFASAYACDCPHDEYINLDPIDSILITVTDTQTQETTDVTNNFTTYAYNGEQVTISELFENLSDWHDGFQIDMTEYENIPDSSIFNVKVILESGTELDEQTQEINFE